MDEVKRRRRLFSETRRSRSEAARATVTATRSSVPTREVKWLEVSGMMRLS